MLPCDVEITANLRESSALLRRRQGVFCYLDWNIYRKYDIKAFLSTTYGACSRNVIAAMIILLWASLPAVANHRIRHPLFTMLGPIETYIFYQYRCLRHMNI